MFGGVDFCDSMAPAMLPIRALWVSLPAIALLELVLQSGVGSRPPPRRDLAEAAAFVREAYREGDLVVVAPHWLAQARLALGDEVLPLRDQARPDEAAYRRLWEVSVGGARAPESSGRAESIERSFGLVTVRLYGLTPSAVVVADFVALLEQAVVSSHDGRARRPCDRRGRRWVCQGGIAEGWVGTETISDLEHRARRCIWAPPLERGRRLRIEFRDIGREGARTLEGHTAIDYVVGRRCSVDPVDLAVEIDGVEVRTIRHHDCESWRAFQVDLPDSDDRIDVAFVVSAPDPRRRHFCFQAQLRREP